jgi:hypothetical protein
MQEKRHNNFNRPNLLAEYEYECGRLIGQIVAKSNMKKAEYIEYNKI